MRRRDFIRLASASVAGAPFAAAAQQTAGSIADFYHGKTLRIIVGATANLTGFAQGQPIESARATALWIFVTAIPLTALGTLSAWAMTRDDSDPR